MLMMERSLSNSNLKISLPRVLSFVLLLVVAAALGTLLMMVRNSYPMGPPIVILFGAVLLHILAWFRRVERSLSISRLFGWSLLITVGAIIGWVTLFCVLGVVSQIQFFVMAGMLLGLPLGIWTSGSMALLRIKPFQ
jgi:hypothetical protein